MGTSGLITMADTSTGYVADLPRDEPHCVIAVFDQPMTCAQASELGRAFGALGFTARFVGGTVAEFVTLGAKCRSELRDDG